MNQPPHAPPPQKSNTVMIVVLVVFALLVVFGGIFAALAIFGMRKYVANAKTAEARNSVGQMSRLAAEAYERDGKLCPSASAPIPSDPSMISGKKYQSTTAEWTRDQAQNAGFACLKFEMDFPQYYQYEYRATPTDFTAIARGDVNGNGVFSEFSIKGVVQNGHLVVSPNILEKNPEE